MQPHAKTVTFTGMPIDVPSNQCSPCRNHVSDTSAIKGDVTSTTIPYDYLVYAVGAETQTFNIPGVKEHALFMKQLSDAEKVGSLIPLLCFEVVIKALNAVPKSYNGLFVLCIQPLNSRNLT